VSDALSLESVYLGGQPLLGPFLQRLRLRAFLQEALGPPDRRIKLPPVDSALLLVRNFTLSRHPLYGVPAWARRFDPSLLELDAERLRFVNDDRLGRTLDRLFESDLRSLRTSLVVHMVREFGVHLERLHNDSTSLTFSGVYREKAPRKDGRRRLRIVHGFNKDHRPDLKQLVWALTVSGDGAVPVHYNVYDGNVTDDGTHIETWEVLRAIVGGSEFLYVADSKLCTKENLAYLRGRGGHFLTVLPRTRKEDARFKEWILQHAVPWQVIWERPPLRRKDDPPDRFEALEDPEPSAEGYRIVWYRSTEKWKRDERAREQAIHTARFELHRLGERVGTRSLKTREQVQAAVDQVLDQTQTRPWVRVELVAHPRHRHKQVGPGRPGKHTRYVRVTTVVFEPVVTLDAERIRASAAADGLFPLVTDLPVERRSPLDLLQIYKYQAFLEKRHEQLETAAELIPVNYKSPERIEAFLFLYFVAVMIHALLERQVRESMKARGIRSIPLYPEERECRAPTADRILALFEPLRRHRLFERGELVKTFWDELDGVQRTVLDLLEISPAAYGQGS
jgi:transposase